MKLKLLYNTLTETRKVQCNDPHLDSPNYIYSVSGWHILNVSLPLLERGRSDQHNWWLSCWDRWKNIIIAGLFRLWERSGKLNHTVVLNKLPSSERGLWKVEKSFITVTSILRLSNFRALHELKMSCVFLFGSKLLGIASLCYTYLSQAILDEILLANLHINIS